MRNKICKSLMFCVFAILISSCASRGARVSGDYGFESDSNMGLIAVSSAYTSLCSELIGLRMPVVSLADLNDQTGLAVVGFFSNDFEGPPPENFYVLELLEGDYLIPGVQTHLYGRGFHDILLKNLKFQVKANQITYLGEIEYIVAPGCSVYTKQISDRWNDRDRKIFRERVPNLDPDLVIKKVIEN